MKGAKAVQLQGGNVLGVPLDEDPFAMAEGVRMLPGAGAGARAGSRSASPSRERPKSKEGDARRPKSRGMTRSPGSVEDEAFHSAEEEPDELAQMEVDQETRPVTPPIVAGGDGDDKDRLSDFLREPQLLMHLLEFLSFYDWCTILSLSRAVRHMLVQNVVLRETVLESFLRTVGYSRWMWRDPEPLVLSLQVCFHMSLGIHVPNNLLFRTSMTI